MKFLFSFSFPFTVFLLFFCSIFIDCYSTVAILTPNISQIQLPNVVNQYTDRLELRGVRTTTVTVCSGTDVWLCTKVGNMFLYPGVMMLKQSLIVDLFV